MEKTKLTLPTTILLASVVLGAFYYSSEMARQQSIEKQQAIKMEEDRKITEANIIQQQQEQLTKEKKEQADSLFEKNIECEKYKDSILGKIDQYNKNQKPEVTNTAVDETYRLYMIHQELKGLFYSPKINSCLYLVDESTLIKSDPNIKVDEGMWITDSEYYFLNDAFSDKMIDIINTPVGEMTMDPSEVDKFVNQYRDNAGPS